MLFFLSFPGIFGQSMSTLSYIQAYLKSSAEVVTVAIVISRRTAPLLHIVRSLASYRSWPVTCGILLETSLIYYLD